MGHACWCKWCFLSDFFGIKWCDHFPKKKSSWLSSFSPLKLTIVGQKKIRHTQTYHISCFFVHEIPIFSPLNHHVISILPQCLLNRPNLAASGVSLAPRLSVSSDSFRSASRTNRSLGPVRWIFPHGLRKCCCFWLVYPVKNRMGS